MLISALNELYKKADFFHKRFILFVVMQIFLITKDVFSMKFQIHLPGYVFRQKGLSLWVWYRCTEK